MLGWRKSLDAFSPIQRSPERERKCLRARIQKLDLELAIGDGLGLSDQLIHPLLGDRAVALVVDVDAVSGARRLSINKHAKSNRGSRHGRSHDEVKIAGMKTIGDPPIGLVERGGLFPDRPVA